MFRISLHFLEMLIVFAFYLALRCNYDDRIKNATIRAGHNRVSLSNKISSKWKPIRITVNNDILEGKEESPLSCYNVGQIIEYDDERVHTCEEQDIITQKQITTIRQTMDNVVNFLSNTLKVQSIIGSIRYGEGNEAIEFNNSDFVIMTSHRYSSSFVASAMSLDTDDTYWRPTIGMIYFNTRDIPNEPVNESDWKNEFFFTVLHEITHALGFSNNMFEHYHPHENPEPYKDIICKLTKYGKTFSFLVTPHSHIFAKKRFGVDVFTGDNGTSCPSGIELEDGGSEGTAGSHLEMRTYYTEYMIGMVTYSNGPFVIFTDATMAVLLDTGNYKINWANIKPLVYGHQESINGNPIPGFAIDPPQITFPSNYLTIINEGTRIDLTGFDYRYYGSGKVIYPESRVNCNDEIFVQYCQAKRFIL